MDIEFKPWPKTPRLFRDCVITEKIDGTNAGIQILQAHWDDVPDENPADHGFVALDDDAVFRVVAQSRKRLIWPGEDNFGFAAWVREHATGLLLTLGPGTHFGEWWGSGIQRGYGLPKGEKRFSLFAVDRYNPCAFVDGVPGLDTVPVLYRGRFDTDEIQECVEALAFTGSWAAPGFDRPEGVIVWHEAARQVFKVLIENDDQPKGEAA